MTFPSLKTEGGLLPADLLEQIALGEIQGQKSEDFGLQRNRRLTDEIAAAWSDARAYWNAFQHALQRLPTGDPATTPTREQWVIPLLRSLGYADVTYTPRAAEVEGQTYAISHRAGTDDSAPPLHIVGAGPAGERDKILERRPPSGRPRLSPHTLIQEYLNRTEHLWGIVTNGIRLRLLRDSSRMTRPAYVEFDLEQMLTAEKFADFALFYRLVHRSRLPKSVGDASYCPLETYYQQALAQGGRVRDKLRHGVEEALKILGNGLLIHPANERLRVRLQRRDLNAEDYYRQLLRLIYRLLFLMVSEERGLIVFPQHTKGAGDEDIYLLHYSVSRLRTLAERFSAGPERHGDLWLGLRATFRLFADEEAGKALGIAPLNGDLFSPFALPDLEGTHLSNGAMLTAVRHLALYTENRVTRRINYAALDVEELGSVYESLLDYRPVVTGDNGGAVPSFDLVFGSERKTTGSYYTRPELVHELIKSALDPVMDEQLSIPHTPADKERTLLSLKVCDLACGSGHFLLAAARRIGRELAKVRSGEDEPTPEQFRLAVRDVIAHCIYGVDLNPLAVDLCKLALWLEGHWMGKPLSFLDHRIKCGNSLIGVLNPHVLTQGIPDEAFNPVTGDDKKVASALKKRNRVERRGQRSLTYDVHLLDRLGDHADRFRQLLGLAEDTPSDVRRKADLYRQSREHKHWWHDWTAANLWTAAFFVPVTDADDPCIPTHERFMDYLDRDIADGRLAGKANALAVQRGFFHWHLEFPEVFSPLLSIPSLSGRGMPEGQSGVSIRVGFDVVLGNPPWERIKLQEEEHWLDDPSIARAPNKAERTRRVEEYRRGNDHAKRARVARFDEAKHDAEAQSKFVRGSGRFPLTAMGDVNTYALFTELARQLINPNGRAGIIVPAGIATDDTTKVFFDSLVERQNLVSLLGFINEGSIFVDVLHNFKFCALTMSGANVKVEHADFAFLCHNFEHAQQMERHFNLSREDLALVNPNTRTCPVFRTLADAELTMKIYRSMPILVNEQTGENPWGVKLMTMFHMANDSGLFETAPSEGLLPLYEGKMMHQFDHRFASYESLGEQERMHMLPETSLDKHRDPAYTIHPCYYVARSHINAKLVGYVKQWLLGFWDVTSSGLARTVIYGVPRCQDHFWGNISLM